MLLTRLEKETSSKKIAVFICAAHRCCTHRGVKQTQNKAVSMHMTMDFQHDAMLRKEFLTIAKTHMQLFKD